ncbi:MAG: pentapeptide repeat-containing protein, partial [Bacteroidota bacterium]
RDFLRQQRRLEILAEEWKRRYRPRRPFSKQLKEKGDDYLLKGDQLRHIQYLQKKNDKNFPLSRLAEEYISRSKHAESRLAFLTGSITFFFLLILVPAFIKSRISTGRKLVPLLQLINSYDANNNKIERSSLLRNLEEIHDLDHSLEGLNLDHADLSTIHLRGANLSYSSLNNVNLNNSNLLSSDLSNVNLRGASLINAHLDGVDFSNADVSQADLNFASLFQANIIETNFFRSNLSNVDFRYAKLHNSDFRYANLSKANFDSTRLKNVNFSFSNLTKTDLSKTDLSEVNLMGANLYQANLRVNFFNSPHRIFNWSDSIIYTALICETILPRNSKLDSNRDCEELGIMPQSIIEK